MKWRLFLLVTLSLLISVTGASAASPDYHFALMQCTGLTLTDLAQANQMFDTQYGWEHQLTTPAQWSGSYEARVNEFSNSLGCQDVLKDGQLTHWARIYIPTFKWYFGK